MKIIRFLIVYILIQALFLNNALAGAAPKWEIVENVYDKSKNVVEVTARKVSTDAANSGTYRVRVPVDSSALGKTVKGMLWIGVATAAASALIEGVGWVIDEGSKVIYKKPKSVNGESDSIDPSWRIYYRFTEKGKYVYFGNIAAMAAYVAKSEADRQGYALRDYKVPTDPGHDNLVSVNYDLVDRGWYSAMVNRITNNNYDPSAPPTGPETDRVPVSDSELGDLILGDSTEPNAPPEPNPDIITDAYNPNNPVSDAPAPAAVGDALSDANPTPDSEKPPVGDSKPKPNVDTDGDGKPDAYDPNAPSEGNEFELPAFCSWAPAVCDFFKVQKQDNKEIKENQKEQIKQDASFFESVKDWFDWTKEDLPDEDSKLDIPEPPQQEIDTDIAFSGQCPDDKKIPFNIGAFSYDLNFSYSLICQPLSQAKPILILVGAFLSALIIGGIRQ